MTHEDYSAALGGLTETARLAFACGCAEHILPLFPDGCDSRPLVEAVEAAWRSLIISQPMNRVQQAALENRVKAAVPSVGDDERLEAELGMNVGVVVMDLLACAGGDTDTAEQVGLGVLNTLTVAIDALGHEDPGDWSADIARPERLHPKLLDEWTEQLAMLTELRLGLDASKVLVWRETHRRRGRDIAGSFGPR